MFLNYGVFYIGAIIFFIINSIFSLLINGPLKWLRYKVSGHLDTNIYNDKSSSTKALLLLHGWNASEMQFIMSRPMIDQILKEKNKDYRVYTFDLDRHNEIKCNNISDYTNRVIKYIREIIYQKPTTKLIIVGHCMGGLIASEIAIKTNLVDTVVSLATPWYGAPILDWLSWHPSYSNSIHKQMMRDSAYIKNLRQLVLNSKHYKTITCGFKYDFIVPEGYYHLEADHIKNIEVFGYGHCLMIAIYGVWEKILDVI